MNESSNNMKKYNVIIIAVIIKRKTMAWKWQKYYEKKLIINILK